MPKKPSVPPSGTAPAMPVTGTASNVPILGGAATITISGVPVTGISAPAKRGRPKKVVIQNVGPHQITLSKSALAILTRPPVADPVCSFTFTWDGNPTSPYVPEPSMKKWAEWMETAKRQVKLTPVINNIEVSTVFLGIDHAHGAGTPMLFETMVFGSKLDGRCRRYADYQSALAGHDEIVNDVRDEEGLNEVESIKRTRRGAEWNL